MTTYLVLLRGINVGGKNKLPMADLRAELERLGFENVSTYIASGNVLLDSKLGAAKVAETIEVANSRSTTNCSKNTGATVRRMSSSCCARPRNLAHVAT